MNPLTEKACPSCAEAIKVEAKKCRFCGHEFTVEEILEAMNKVADAKARARSHAAAQAARDQVAARLEELQNRRNGFFGCGIIIALVGFLLLLLMVVMFFSTPGEKTTQEMQHFSALMCTTWGAIPLLFVGFLCVRAGIRAHQQRQAYLKSDETHARNVRIAGKRARWFEWSAGLIAIGVMLLVIRVGYFPPPEDAKMESSEPVAKLMCAICGVSPLLLSGLFILIGILVKPTDDGPPAVEHFATYESASENMNRFLSWLTPAGVQALASFLSNASPSETEAFALRLRRASLVELQQIADEFNAMGDQAGS